MYVFIRDVYFILFERMKSTKERFENDMPYDSNILMPSLKEIHNRFGVGLFDCKTWNKLIDLYFRLPKSVQGSIDFDKFKDAENNKEMCVILFVQIIYYLDKKGFLRDKTSIKGGFID